MRENQSVLADVCEAVIAALYLDGGLTAAKGFVEQRWEARLEARSASRRAIRRRRCRNGCRRAGCRCRSIAPLRPKVRRIAGRFTVTVNVEGLDPATASGTSKRMAETAAAAAALAALDLVS